MNLSIPPDAAIVVLSPHLDDAVLSCGALMADAARQGARVVVITVFNGRPTFPVSEAAARFHARCGHTAATAMAEREREDDAALAVIGARTIRLGMPEALYRRGPDGEPLYETDDSIFARRPPDEETIRRSVGDRIRIEVDAFDPWLLMAPLGIGGHVDHVIVADATRDIGRTVLHYEDAPYVLYERCRDWQRDYALHACITHASSAQAWEAKLRGIECYESQREVLWYDPDRWRSDLTAHATDETVGEVLERYWCLDG
jgi:LmbE family N-acetylglucosaminyl deacetylase